MKKMVFFLLIAAVAASAVWGQTAYTVISANNRVDIGGFFVDQTLSTENRYSAGIFSSYADDYLWFSGYDADVGTFLFLGGWPSNGTDVDTTYDLNNNTAARYKLTFGLGKSTKYGYLGLYFNGHIVEANGSNNGLSGSNKVVTDTARYDNNVAILYGNKKHGAFRLDLGYNGTTYTDTYVNDKPAGAPAQTVTAPPRIAIGYGREYKDMDVYAQLGYRFPTMTVNTDPDGSNKSTDWGDSILALQAGLEKALKSSDNSQSSFTVDFLIGNVFGASSDGAVKYTRGGIFLLGADAAYKQIIKADDKLSFGFKPNATIGFFVDDSLSIIAGDTTYDSYKDIGFELGIGINVGVKYQVNQKFALYSGLGLDLLDWRAGGYVDGKDTDGWKASAWSISGINPRSETLHNNGAVNALGFGLTFTPSKTVTIGAGLNALLGRIIYFNVDKMKLQTGLNNSSGDSTELGWLSANLFGGLSFDLTISVKF